MKPLIKWPGGKTSEIRQFQMLIPEYDRYIEPFLGGGALYFHLNPGKAVINDISSNLMDFYRMLKNGDEELKRILNLYDASFTALKNLCEEHFDELYGLYRLIKFARQENIDVESLQIHRQIVLTICNDERVCSELVRDKEEFIQTMLDCVWDKLTHTADLEAKKPMPEKDLNANIVTGFTSGFYIYFRSIFNYIADGTIVPTPQYRIANFYFIREYCYGSMFRYNAKGEFNIPYGGLTYNKKEMAPKIERMYGEDTQRLLRRTEIYGEDFESLMRRLKLTNRDFLFLDPPYDSDFSEYEGNSFSRDDQKRLADFLKSTEAQFVLIIKNTQFIYDLYKDDFRILTFENKYVYNMRSRNERTAEHLIITNIPEETIPWIRENY